MATVGVTHYAQLPGSRKLMPTRKSGTEFLVASHFTIAQDSEVTSPSLKSIFKKDYTPWHIACRPPASEPPPPAEVLHKDDRFFAEKASETSKAYKFRGANLPRPDMSDVSAKLRTTNFKMDRDVSKFDSFHTSHNLDFYAKEFQGVPKSMPKENPMESFIPQGDPEKAQHPQSDYRDRFRGHDALTTKPEKALSMHQVGPPTIIGDGRLHHFATTHNDIFKGVSFPRIHSFPAPTGSNIPQGDGHKETTMQTVHQASFGGHDAVQKPYNKNNVMGKLGQTNFKTHDGHGTFDTYLSTAAESYVPTIAQPSRSAPAKHRNHSDFPEGDRDPNRVTERASTTTNRFYHANKADYGPAAIVSGADKRTRSNIWFGEPHQGDTTYNTTTSATFKPVRAPYKLPSSDMATKSTVPMDYYAGEKSQATTWSDFQDPRQGKTIPNSSALENLKNSHIHAPLGEDRQFATEHLDQFIPKSSRRVPIDSGRLQRSTVPLGTLEINP